MNCSQLLERRTTTNWEKAAELLRIPRENPAPTEADTRRWGALRFSSNGQTFAPKMASGIAPWFKPASS